ncbi:hypothetical protein E0Z10_g9736 [Xylaria hypoxylon]|uniref:FAR1 domain-containing protein n=1 Tax=Xylaria hypoxylon TaxID=37992 RepID=A0A4Z0YI81_9PEZI|nr:hypothetical protein E0Z10_g9736 [Xylaria hypoxylon]
MPLAPPPDGAAFPTWAECLRSVQSHAASEGYAVNSKGQAKNKDTGLYRRYVIRCDKSGAFKSAAQIGTRRVSSKKTDCPFNAACNIRPDGCFLRVLVPEHNHPPSALPAAHVQHRKLTDEQRQLVETRAIERKSIKLIWQELKDLDPNTYITFKDVDNAVQRFRKKAKDGATGVQAIMYKLVERQDLFCFTLERECVVQGAFWVPHWSTDLWMRPNGTPDILVMLAEHIANRPVLPILEMNSVLNTAGFGSPLSTRAMPADPTNLNLNADLNTPSSPNNLATDNGNSSASPTPLAPNLTSASSAQNALNDAGRSNNGLDASLGAGYAILPDKSNATLLWLHSAVELLRQRIPQCPKPRFITLTDFQTAEKNILVEISKGGMQHRQMHVVFGRVLTNDEENPAAHHGVRTRKPRVERGRSDVTGHDEEAEDDDEEDGEQTYGDGEQEQEEGDEGDNDQDMDGDHDSDAEIARQLTGGHAYNAGNNHNNHDHHTGHNHRDQNLDHGYNQNPQQIFEHSQPRGPNSISDPNHVSGRLPLPAHAPRHMQGQPPAQMAYDGMMGRMPSNYQSRPM